MIATTLGEVATAVGGTLIDAEPDTLATDVCSDSRLVTSGSLFVAIAGNRVDGRTFAADAMSAGAVAVLASTDTEAPTIVVPDVLVALGALARYHLGRLPNLTVIAITGSVGKTTAKDLTATVLSSHGPTVSPPGSFNNELGLPLTVLEADESTRYLVLEMGARGKGHIAYLCGVAPPHIGVELGVGTAHIGEFGSQESIAQAKAELVQALPADGIAILNRDDAYVTAMASATRARVLWFGFGSNAQVTAHAITADELDRASFKLATPSGSAPVTLKYVGAQAIPNALASAAVAEALGLKPRATAAALSAAEPRSKWRMEVANRSDGLVVINDAYNASPESMRAALKSLKQIAHGRRCWAVLGEMLELGDTSAAEHDAIGRLVVRLDVQRLVVVGEGARPIHQAAGLEGSWGQESMYVSDADAALQVLRDQLQPDDVVLVKASRAAGLEVIAAALLAEVPA
ncbi:MAG: UDP-N-acetylmuramoyl-tripeptide--D-alanyl-D-alanine ligase [Actinomycetes bacterium]